SMQSPTNPHALGIAVDIAAFGGHTISTAAPEEEVQAFLALLKALAPGRYRMGLPKAPEPVRPADPGVPLPDDVNGDPAAVDASRDSTTRRAGGVLPSRGGRRQDGGRQDSGRQDGGQQDSGRQDSGRQDSERQDSGRQDSGQQDNG